MKRIFYYILLGIIITANSLYGIQTEWCHNFYSFVEVYEPDGNPVSGVQVKLYTALFGEEESESSTVYGYTASDGTVTLNTSVCIYEPITSHYMQVDITDDSYNIISSSNTSSWVSTLLYPEFEILYDADRDLIDDNIEIQIAEKFKPILHKHSHDYQPGLQNFEKLLSDGDFDLYVYSDAGGQVYYENISGSSPTLHRWYKWHWDTYGFGSVSQGRCSLDLDNSMRYTSAPFTQRPVYYHVYKDANYFYVQYWFYFSFDDKGEFFEDSWHESDWEHVCIRLTENSGVFTPDKVNFYCHIGGRTYDKNTCWWSSTASYTYSGMQQGYSENRTHLHVWIGANGHASYNRYANVYRITNIVTGDYYQDRVDYYSSGNDLYFHYDILIKFGEVSDGTFIECPDSGNILEYHRYPKGPGSIAWSAFIGRCGFHEFPFNPIGKGGSYSPVMPSVEDMYHDWVTFTLGNPRFGNDGFWEDWMVSWVVDDSIGD